MKPKVPHITYADLRTLDVFANGDMNIAQLANKLCISQVTANKHLIAARRALGVKTNIAAVKRAIAQKLMQYDEE